MSRLTNLPRRVLDVFRRRVLGITPDPTAYSTIVGQGSVVPVQIEAYFLALNRYVPEGGTVLDVGFGLGYGLNILAIKAAQVHGVDVDPQVYRYCQDTVAGRNPRLATLQVYDGYTLDFPDGYFDVVTCVDVLEHVEDYDRLLTAMLRVARVGVFLSTPNRRPESTNHDGTPKNYWHRREWSFDELDAIVQRHGTVDWHCLDGPYEGPFTCGAGVTAATFALCPFIRRKES